MRCLGEHLLPRPAYRSGFSHAEKGQTVSTTELAAIDVAAFVDIVCPPT